MTKSPVANACGVAQAVPGDFHFIRPDIENYPRRGVPTKKRKRSVIKPKDEEVGMPVVGRMPPELPTGTASSRSTAAKAKHKRPSFLFMVHVDVNSGRQRTEHMQPASFTPNAFDRPTYFALAARFRAVTERLAAVRERPSNQTGIA